MIEFIPFLLIMIGWNPASPAESMTVARFVQVDEAECRTEGARRLAAGPQLDGLPADAEHSFLCIAAPSADEYDTAFERVK